MSLNVSSSPHIRDQAKSSRIMLDVVIALIPALIASVYIFGLRALLVICLTVGSAVLFEYLCRRVMKRENTISDWSAVVTGLLLAFNLPPSIPLYIPVVGAFIAIVIVKQMFGGLGQNFVNPALTARIILTLSIPAVMTRWTLLSRHIGDLASSDLVSTATPLYLLRSGSTAADLPSYLDLFLGLKGGCIGEVSVLALLIGAAYLMIRKVISGWIPFVYILTVFGFTALMGLDPVYHVLSGGLFIGAFYMATDYVTSPLTVRGKIIFAVGCGLLTSVIRVFGGMTEGVSFSIIFMNILTPHIDRWTIPVAFGGARHAES